ncbi:MAG: serpin family protein [Gemmataceae bacterium]
MNRRHFLCMAAAAGASAPLARLAYAEAPKGEAASGSTAFACDLYGKLRTQPGNVFFSPLSISAALTMTSAGAAGATLAEMVKVLHLPADQAAAHASAVDTTKALLAGAASGGYELSIANALWAQQGFPFKEQFLATLKNNYGAAPERTDFAANPEAARKAINAWVERQTKNKIKDLFAPGIIDGLTRLVLANAVYFKGDWQRPFMAGATGDKPFLAANGSVKVPMMHQTNQLRYAEGDGWQSLGLGYKGGKLEMVFVLPRDVDGLGKLEGTLSSESFTTYVGGLKPERVAVTLPRFKATAEFNLNKTLEALGMAKAFSQTEADFSRMTAGDPLHIQAVVHKAYVDVNEKGSEAAAATGVAIGVRSAAPSGPPKVFKADHPFLFAIRDSATGTLLFLGRYSQP